MAEAQAGIESSWDEVGGFRRLNSARSGSVSSVSSAGTPRYPVTSTPVPPLGLRTPAPGQGAPYYR